MSESVPYNYQRAASYGLIAYMLLAIGMVFFKLVIGGYPVSQILMTECVVCTPLFIMLAVVQGGVHKLKTHYPAKQLCRGLLQTGAALSGMASLRLMPLSTSTMLGYSMPFFIVLAARIFLKEQVNGKNWLVIILGFTGVAFVAQPEGVTMTGVSLQILSCILCSGNILLIKTMDKDATITFPFYTVLVGGVVQLAIVLYNGFQPYSLTDLFYVSMAGIACFVGAQFLFASYRMAPLHFTTPFQYTQLIWIVLIGYFIWADLPTIAQLVGVGIIAASSLYLTYKGEKADA